MAAKLGPYFFIMILSFVVLIKENDSFKRNIKSFKKATFVSP